MTFEIFYFKEVLHRRKHTFLDGTYSKRHLEKPQFLRNEFQWLDLIITKRKPYVVSKMSLTMQMLKVLYMENEAFQNTLFRTALLQILP